MNLRCLMLIGLIVSALAGCSNKEKVKVENEFEFKGAYPDDYEEIHRAMIDGYRTQHVDDAIIRQRTLYPYHFEQDSAELNQLGMRTVHVLSMHYRDKSGTISVRAGGASDELYKARLAEVRQRMTDAGVDLARITIEDRLPGGDGISSDQVVIINERIKEGGMAVSTDDDSSSMYGSSQSGTMNSGGSN